MCVFHAKIESVTFFILHLFLTQFTTFFNSLSFLITRQLPLYFSFHEFYKSLLHNDEMETSSPYKSRGLKSFLPELQSTYEILHGSQADRASKGSVLQRSWAACWAPVLIAQWCTGSVPQGWVLSLRSLCFVCLPISFFILSLCFKEDLFCVIEEGKRGQSIQPGAGAATLSQPPCRCPVMSKRVAVKVSGLGPRRQSSKRQSADMYVAEGLWQGMNTFVFIQNLLFFLFFYFF